MVELRTHPQPKGRDRTSLHLRMCAPVPYPTISGGAAGNVAYGGTVNPPRNRKGGAGNPPPKGARASALPDKILQRAVLMVLEPVYEQDFLECSYGFRPGRGAHQALEALWKGLMNLGGGWVIDLDIEDFFGSVDWGHLRSFLDRRVRDGVVRRAIGKWLNAGVMEACCIPRSFVTDFSVYF